MTMSFDAQKHAHLTELVDQVRASNQKLITTELLFRFQPVNWYSRKEISEWLRDNRELFTRNECPEAWAGVTVTIWHIQATYTYLDDLQREHDTEIGLSVQAVEFDEAQKLALKKYREVTGQKPENIKRFTLEALSSFTC